MGGFALRFTDEGGLLNSAGTKWLDSGVTAAAFGLG